MIRSPLPVAPRPHPGEAISSWVGRIAARYDITGEHLGRFVLDPRSFGVGGVAGLDYRADPALEGALAWAARLQTASVRKLRVVRDDGSAACWHRDAPAWCPACLQEDLARDGEVHGRAAWRLGCCVLCPVHDLLLEHVCCRCASNARCQFRPIGGRLLLACAGCGRQVEPAVSFSRPSASGNAAFGIVRTPELIALVKTLQRNLIAGLAENAPLCAWGPVRSCAELIAMAEIVANAIIGSAEFRVERRVDLFALLSGQTGPLAYEPITLALLTPYAAFGTMALTAIFFESVLIGNPGAHRWSPDGSPQPLNTTTFLAWLGDRERRMLQAVAERWGNTRAIGAAITSAKRPGRPELMPSV